MNTIELAAGVFAMTNNKPGFGNSNVGLIVDSDGLTFVDSGATPERAEAHLLEAKQITQSLQSRLKRVVLSSSRIPFSGGSSALWQAAFYGSETTSEQLDTPASPEAFRRLLPELADAYHDRYETRPISHVVSEPSAVSAAGYGLVLPGESAANLVIFVESASVVFAGALASYGVVPLGFDSQPLQWAESLEQLAQLGKTVVPGHGPVGGTTGLIEQAAYLRACDAAEGKTSRLASGPWNEWANQEFHAVNIERAQRLRSGDTSVPTSMFELLGFEAPEPINEP